MERDERTDDLEEFEAVDTEEGTDMDLEDVEEAGTDTIKKLKAKLKDCESAKMQYLEDLQRAKADFLNTRKRLEDQLARDRERITEANMLMLLPLADSFDMAMKDASWKEADGTWKQGIERIYTQLMSVLSQHGITPFDPVGEEFNPHEHEAVMNSGNGNEISEVFQKGYKRGETVLRPAMVAVGTK
jgi:molecular chaperone GrpE